MDLSFVPGVELNYQGPTQKVRNLTEHWFGKHSYCPNCGHPHMNAHANNAPVADFFCPSCHEDYELKSHSRVFGSTVPDGAYRTMIERLRSDTNPSLFLLQYDRERMSVVNLFVVPKHFFVPAIIQQRKPLSPTARRAGWVGCNIALRAIPSTGRIFLIRDCVVECRSTVLEQWQKTSFLRQEGNESRGWLLSVMTCIERLQMPLFTLADAYRFESDLAQRFPANRHIRPKIRQQLQVLRDKGYLEFLGRGNYRLAGPM